MNVDDVRLFTVNDSSKRVEMSSVVCAMHAQRELNDVLLKHIQHLYISIIANNMQKLQARWHLHETCINTCMLRMQLKDIPPEIICAQNGAL